MSVGRRLRHVALVLALVMAALALPLMAAASGSGASAKHVAGCSTCPRPPEQNI